MIQIKPGFQLSLAKVHHVAVVLAHSRLGLSWCGSSDKLQSLSQFSEELGVQAPRWKGGAQFLFQSHLGVPG